MIFVGYQLEGEVPDVAGNDTILTKRVFICSSQQFPVQSVVFGSSSTTDVAYCYPYEVAEQQAETPTQPLEKYFDVGSSIVSDDMWPSTDLEFSNSEGELRLFTNDTQQMERIMQAEQFYFLTDSQ